MSKEQNQLIPIKLIFSLSLLLFSLNIFAFEISSYEKRIKTGFQIKTVSEKVTRDYLEKNIREFVQKSRPSRLVGSTGHRGSREFIENQLKALN